MGLLTGGTTTASISLWAAVGVGGVGMFLIPCGLAGLEGCATTGERGDIVWGAGELAAIYINVSMFV